MLTNRLGRGIFQFGWPKLWGQKLSQNKVNTMSKSKKHRIRKKRTGRVCRNLVGETFGKWKVLSLLDNRKGQNRKYICLCDPALGGCGSKKEIWVNNLLNGVSRSCGCIRKTKIKTLSAVGKRFGEWRVMSLIDGEKQIYLVRSVASGEEKPMSRKDLVKLPDKHIYKNFLTGQIVGTWNVGKMVHRTQTGAKKGVVIEYLCFCDPSAGGCGKTTRYVRSQSLALGKSLSCGCIRKPRSLKLENHIETIKEIHRKNPDVDWTVFMSRVREKVKEEFASGTLWNFCQQQAIYVKPAKRCRKPKI